MIMVLAMIWDRLDGSGCYIDDRIGLIEEAMNRTYPQSEDELRLMDIVQRGLRMVARDEPPSSEFGEDSNWAYNTFVRAYFLERSK